MTRTCAGATRAHMDAYVVPIWREQWHWTVAIKSHTRLSMERHVLYKDSLMKIGWMKSRGVESASWATIPPILRDRTAEITRSEIRVMGHDPTNFARISLWIHVLFPFKLNFWSNREEIKRFWRNILSSSWFSCFLDLIPHSLKQDNHESLQENDQNLPLNAKHTSKTQRGKYSSINANWSQIFMSIRLVVWFVHNPCNLGSL